MLRCSFGSCVTGPHRFEIGPDGEAHAPPLTGCPAPAEGVALAGRPRRVLVIEAAPPDRARLRRQVVQDGMACVEAGDGFTGLAIARELRPDLVLCDVRLPGCDGFELLRQLREDPATRAIPVIFVAGPCRSAERARGLDLGASDFIARPFDPIELRARIRVVLRTKELQGLLEQRAHLDGLTGLHNRLALEERLAAEWALCRRHGRPLTVLIADLDHFKAINDAYGHWMGDEALRRAAEALRSRLRGGDFVARYGGEEFVVLAADCDLAGAVSIAERFRAALAALPLSCDGRPIALTASIGVASAGPDAHDQPRDVLCAADQALYQAKRDGRNAVRFWHNALGRACPAPERPGPDAAPAAVRSW